MKASRDISVLLTIMKALRDPLEGCPWDKEQTSRSIARYALEEAAEVVDAIAQDDSEELRKELGDLLLQVVFHAQIHAEKGIFDFGDVVEAITEKMIRRHPHVFGADKASMRPEDVAVQWEQIKTAERAAKNARSPAIGTGLLATVPHSLPALARAVALQDKAATVGFDWKNTRHVLEKIREETREAESAYDAQDMDNMEEEIGDILMAVTNLARHVNINPDLALKRSNAKFESRFAHIEKRLHAMNRSLQDASLDEMEALWSEAKALKSGLATTDQNM